MNLRGVPFLFIVLFATVHGASGQAHASSADGAPSSRKEAAPANNSYIIGAADVLAVTVWKDSTLSGSFLVRPDGKISMPLLGDIQASGEGPMQLADHISQKLKKFMKDPQVSVVVSNIHENFVYLLGEVEKRGPVPISPNMTLLEAISTGGGLTEFANEKKIYILRKVNGTQQRIPVDYKKALKGNVAFNVALTPGDTIVVP